MSWGGQGGYGQGPPQGQQFGGQYGAPAGQRPANSTPGYGSPQYQNAGYGTNPQQRFGAPPQNSYGAPGQNSYGVPGQNSYGAPGQNSYSAQGQNSYVAPGQNSYGAPGQNSFGAPGQNSYGAPGQNSFGTAPSQHGYGSQGQFGGNPHHGSPPGVDPELWTWFQSVDTDNSGKITSSELQQALMNGNWSPFNAETCRLMIGMFDRDRSGSIDIHEFAALWKYIQDWKTCFDRFDTDRSGNIDANELGNAFQTFGYKLSPQFSQLIVRVFDRNKGGYSINFDDFIQACVMLKTLTDKFRVKDVNQIGQIGISYEEFLEMALDTTLIK